MNETEHLLTVLSEECAEVAQRACKAIRFGLSEIQPGHDEDNKRRLERELADLVATADILGLVVRDEDKAAKREKLKKYMGYSREVGTLKEPTNAAIPGTGSYVGTGSHDYPGCRNIDNFFTSDCANGCGCWMGGSRSGGPDGVDPFGKCPKAPKKSGKKKVRAS